MIEHHDPEIFSEKSKARTRADIRPRLRRPNALPAASRRRRPIAAAAGRSRRIAAAILFCLIATTVSTPAGASELRLGLMEALRLSRDNASDVKAAYHDSLAAARGLSTAKSAWLPTLGVTANAFALRPLDPLGFGPIQIETSWQEIYMTNLRLSYPIYTGGKRGNNVRMNRETVRAATADLSASKLSNAYQCRQAYIGLLIADRVVRATEKSLERVEIIGGDIENLFSAGMADSIDILETQLSLRQVRRHLEETRAQRLNASATLARFLGVGADVTIVPAEPIPAPKLDGAAAPPDHDTVVRRPELAALDHRIMAAGHRRSLVKGNVLPVINGMGGYSLVRPEVGDAGGEWRDVGWLGLTLSWNLNLGGGEFSAADQAFEKMRALEMQRTDLERKLTLQARIAWNDLEAAYKLSRIRGEEYDLARRRFRLAEEKRKVGGMTANRFLELEAELTETEQQFEVARLRFFAARTDYLYAIGSNELWEGF